MRLFETHYQPLQTFESTMENFPQPQRQSTQASVPIPTGRTRTFYPSAPVTPTVPLYPQTQWSSYPWTQQGTNGPNLSAPATPNSFHHPFEEPWTSYPLTEQSTTGHNNLPFFPLDANECASPGSYSPWDSAMEDLLAQYPAHSGDRKPSWHPSILRESLIAQDELPSSHRNLRSAHHSSIFNGGEPALGPIHRDRVSKPSERSHEKRHTFPRSYRGEREATASPSESLHLPSTEKKKSRRRRYTERQYHRPKYYCQSRKAEKGFARKSDLARHMKLHNEDKFLCEICRRNHGESRQFSRKDNLKMWATFTPYPQPCNKTDLDTRHIRTAHQVHDFNDFRLSWFNDMEDQNPELPDEDAILRPPPKRWYQQRRPSSPPGHARFQPRQP